MFKHFVSFCCFLILCLSLQAQEQQKDTFFIPTSELEEIFPADSFLTPPDTIPYDWISYQMKALISDADETKTLHVFFVNRIDSIIYVNLNLFGIELGRAVATPDTFVFVNKLDKTFYKGDYSYLAALIGFPLDFYMVQSILNGVDFENFTDTLQPVWQDHEWHFIAPMRSHRTLNLHIMQDISLNADNTIAKNEVTELSRLQTLEISYFDYLQTKEACKFFSRLTLNLEQQETVINIELKNLKINVPGPTRITIPQKFKPIQP